MYVEHRRSIESYRGATNCATTVSHTRDLYLRSLFVDPRCLRYMKFLFPPSRVRKGGAATAAAFSCCVPHEAMLPRQAPQPPQLPPPAQEVAKQSNLAMAVVHRPHLNAGVAEVRVREHLLGPPRRAFLTCGKLLTAWVRLEVVATTLAHPTLDPRPHVLPPGQARRPCFEPASYSSTTVGRGRELSPRHPKLHRAEQDNRRPGQALGVNGSWDGVDWHDSTRRYHTYIRVRGQCLVARRKPPGGMMACTDKNAKLAGLARERLTADVW